jgi:glycerol-3-phosphate acyltransferase PlsY
VIVLVETITLERDADLAEDLLYRGAAVVRFAFVGLRARGQSVVAERLPQLKHLAGAFTSIVVGRHGLGGYRATTNGPPFNLWLYDGRVILAALLIIGAYITGMFPTAHLVGRRLGVNPAREGSGNPGASNVYRLGGRQAGVIVGVIDMLKGALPVGIALLVADMPEAHAVWVAAVAGHVWPVTRGFRGGKGVATAGGAGLVINPLVGLACAGLFLVVVRVARIAALGSLGIAVSYPVIAALVGRPGYEIAVSAGVASILVIRHQSNIRRMLRRDENKLDETGPAAA